MPITDKSGNGVVPNVGAGARPGWSLFSASANGDGNPVPWGGGAGTVIVGYDPKATSPTMGGGTINIKAKFPGKSIDVPVVIDNADQLNITAPGTYDFRMSACELVATLTGATSPVGVSVGIDGYDL